MIRDARKGKLTGFTVGLLLAAAPAIAGTDDVDHTVVAGGGGTVTQGAIKLHWTIGEPVAGPTSAGNTTVTAGFQAKFLGTQQGGPDAGPCSIFCNGFEN